MTAKLTIQLGDDALRALKSQKNITIRLGATPARNNRSGYAEPREGSIPARLLAWAAEDGEPFTTADLVEAFGLSRAHASIVLGKLANGAYPLTRVSRGVYRHQGYAAAGDL